MRASKHKRMLRNTSMLNMRMLMPRAASELLTD